MASTFRTRQQLGLCKIESTAGTDSSPVVGTDAIALEGMSRVLNFESIQTNEHRDTLNSSEDIPAGGFAQVNASVNVKGSGTAGTAPEADDIYRAAGLAVANLAAAVTGTAQAGASTTITLAASGPSSTDDAYEGMVIELDGGTGSGQTRVITGYNGTTKVATVTPSWDTTPDATSTYNIHACDVYSPADQGLENVTFYHYMKNKSSSANSELTKLVGAAANLSFSMDTRNRLIAAMELIGQLDAAPSNVSDPGSGTFDSGVPPVLINASVYLGDVAAAIGTFTLNLNNSVQVSDDPAEEYGHDIAEIMSRDIRATMNPLKGLLSSVNAFADFQANTTRDVWLNWGGTSGNRISILLEDCQIAAPTQEDLNGAIADGLTLKPADVHICFH